MKNSNESPIDYSLNLLKFNQGWSWYVSYNDEKLSNIENIRKIDYQSLIFLYFQKINKNKKISIEENNQMYFLKKVNDMINTINNELKSHKKYEEYKKNINKYEKKNEEISKLNIECKVIFSYLNNLKDKEPYYDHYKKNEFIKRINNYLKNGKKIKFLTLIRLVQILEVIKNNNKINNLKNIKSCNSSNYKKNIKNNMKGGENYRRMNYSRNIKNLTRINNENINLNKGSTNGDVQPQPKKVLTSIKKNNTNNKLYLNNFLTSKIYSKNNKFNLNKLRFQFTRHARSCNNESIGKSFFGKDFEPLLTDKGIQQTIIYSILNKNKYRSNNVFVSCLIRTWCTAVLLYGWNDPNNKVNELTIHVAPFLKEAHKDLKFAKVKTGNHPQILNKTIPMFLEFLNYIKILNEEYWNNLKNIRLLIYKNYEGEGEDFKPIIFNFVKYREDNGKINFKLKENLCVLLPKEECKDPIMKKENIEGYQKDGSLKLFMEWFYRSFQKFNSGNISERVYERDKEKGTYNYIHRVNIVAHSHIMRSYLKKLLNDNLDIYSNIENPNNVIDIISKTNCSIVNTQLNGEYTITEPGYYPDDYIETLNIGKKNSGLCGTEIESECTLSKSCSL